MGSTVTGFSYVVVRPPEAGSARVDHDWFYSAGIGSTQLERATSFGIFEIGPAKFPSNLFFAFMKAGERYHAAWNLSRLNC